MSDKIILSTSDEAATYRTDIKGWVSKNGRFYGDGKEPERIARFDGCTHVPCTDCGEATPKGYTHCQKCRDRRDEERYLNLEKVDWFEGMGPMYSRFCDRYFDSWDEVDDHSEESGIPVEKMQLVVCKPVCLSSIDEDRWADELPEDGELPEDVVIALAELNKVLTEAGAVSWYPGKNAVCMRSEP